MFVAHRPPTGEAASPVPTIDEALIYTPWSTSPNPKTSHSYRLGSTLGRYVLCVARDAFTSILSGMLFIRREPRFIQGLARMSTRRGNDLAELELAMATLTEKLQKALQLTAEAERRG